MKIFWVFVFGLLAFGEVYEVSKTSTIQRDNTKEVVTDLTTMLMWQDDVNAKTTKRDWSGAIEYCKDLRFAGYNDWRLPTIEELLLITDDTKYNPAIKNGFYNVVSGRYWSCSPSVSGASGAWGVRFGGGYDLWGDKSSTYYVRCVRDRK